MNNRRSQIYKTILILALGLVSFGIYKLHMYVSTFSNRVAEMNNTLQTLQEKKDKIALYQKILSKGSSEQAQIDAYILSGDSVFTAITNLEKEGKKTGLFEDGGILSVSKRENEVLKNLQAGEVVVNISIQGSVQNIDAYIQALAHLPYVSHIEKIDLQFSGDTTKNRAVITLVITELI